MATENSSGVKHAAHERESAYALRLTQLQIILAYSALVLIWGSTWLAIKVQLHYTPPFTGVGFRYILAGAVVFLCGRALRTGAAPFRPKLTLVMAVCLFGVNYLLNYIAELRVASGLTAVLFGTLPFFVFGFGRLFGDRTSKTTVMGAFGAVIGVAVVSISQGLYGSFWYALAAVGAALFAGFGQVYVKRFAASDAFTAMPRAMLLSGVVITAVALVFERPDLSKMANQASIAALLYLALVGTALAFYLNFWLLQHIKAAALSLFALLTPLVALFIGSVIGHEALSVRDVIGVALVVGGAAVALFSNRPARLAPVDIDEPRTGLQPSERYQI